MQYVAEVRPTWFFAVPQIWETLKAALLAELAGYRGAAEAPDAATEKVRLEQADRPVPQIARSAVVPDMMLGIVEALRLVTEPGDTVVVNPPIYPPSMPSLRISDGGSSTCR